MHAGGPQKAREKRGGGTRSPAPPPLRAYGERPRGCRAAEQCDELAASHSITSSARTRRVGGTSRPSALAVFRLMTSSSFVGNSTVKSPGAVPFKILTT